MTGELIFPYESEMNIEKSWTDIQRIYTHIVDNKSPKIYIYRLLLALTGDVKYVRKLIQCTDIGREFERFLKVQTNIYIYGAGIRGRRLVQMFPEMRWRSYIDIKVEGVCNGLPILKPENVQIDKEDIILITNYKGYEEIKSNLLSFGIEKNQIKCMNDFEMESQENQYFEERCIKNFKFTSKAFLDVGCYDGRDSIRFLQSRLCDNNSIYAFEPDDENYQNCKKTISNYKNIRLYNIGLSDSRGKETFFSKQGEKARITSGGNCFVEMDTIDALLSDTECGIIKMDIEGSEKMSLKGGKNHIERDHPNMMISIYHKIEDIIEIPKLLLSLNPDYRFAFGHYSIGSASETVLYVFE